MYAIPYTQNDLVPYSLLFSFAWSLRISRSWYPMGLICVQQSTLAAIQPPSSRPMIKFSTASSPRFPAEHRILDILQAFVLRR